MYGVIARIKVCDPESEEAHWIWFDKDLNSSLRPCFSFNEKEAQKAAIAILDEGETYGGYPFDVVSTVRV